ncbi:antibiotic biosynthesis monooxygenase family protein [Belnapia moabensis]|uniref:antibiotic biosynthesis monooxygenase family protein n=1 Tax=Belnapia moabensis TaxID=365533 RepID=UPI0005B9C875|nr:antibiotic biosynthesis monooxygenase [Belnapia moabensis]
MYVVIRRTRLSGSAEEVVRRTRDHIVPLVDRRPGFRGYCAFVTEEGNTALSVGIFDDKDAAMQADQRVREWIEANMRDLMPEAPEVVAGETVFDSIAHAQGQMTDRQQALFIVVRTYRGLPGQAEAMHSAVSQHTLPAIMDAPGFRGFYAFRDEAAPDRAISVSLFDSREHATHSHEEVLSIMREQLGEMAYREPQVTMGETAVLAAV